MNNKKDGQYPREGSIWQVKGRTRADGARMERVCEVRLDNSSRVGGWGGVSVEEYLAADPGRPVERPLQFSIPA